MSIILDPLVYMSKTTNTTTIYTGHYLDNIPLLDIMIIIAFMMVCIYIVYLDIKQGVLENNNEDVII
jgi:hypothetical protein